MVAAPSGGDALGGRSVAEVGAEARIRMSDAVGFWPAFWGAIVVTVVSWLVSMFLPDRKDA